MIGQAKSNPTLYAQMRKVCYEDDEFPPWWYSPARAETSAEQAETSREKLIKAEESTEELSEAQLEPVSPHTSAPI